jgi:NDP-sugar pyrophosphorylase family protein
MGTASVSSAPVLVVLAAGLSSRHGGVSLAEPVGPGGESIVDYSIYDACHAGFGRVIFIVRRATEQMFREMAHARFGKRIPVDFVMQDMTTLPPGVQVLPGRTRPFGTTLAVLAAEHAVHGPFAVINVDDFYGAASYRALASHLKSHVMDYAIAGFALRNTLSEFGAVSRGMCDVDESGYLRRIVELRNVEREKGHAVSVDANGTEARLSGDETVSMNMWAFTPAIFQPLREVFREFLTKQAGDPNTECILPDAVNVLIQSGQARVRVLRTHDEWFGMTYGDEHVLAVEHIRRLISDGVYPRRLWG